MRRIYALALSLLLASGAAAQNATPTPELRPYAVPVLSHVHEIYIQLRSTQQSPGGPVTREGDGTVVLVGRDGSVLQRSRIDLLGSGMNPSVDRVRQDLGLTAGQMAGRSLVGVYLDWVRLRAETRLLPAGTPTPASVATSTPTPTATATVTQ